MCSSSVQNSLPPDGNGRRGDRIPVTGPALTGLPRPIPVTRGAEIHGLAAFQPREGQFELDVGGSSRGVDLYCGQTPIWSFDLQSQYDLHPYEGSVRGPVPYSLRTNQTGESSSSGKKRF
jgi:hypothetical protein